MSHTANILIISLFPRMSSIYIKFKGNRQDVIDSGVRYSASSSVTNGLIFIFVIIQLQLKQANTNKTANKIHTIQNSAIVN